MIAPRLVPDNQTGVFSQGSEFGDDLADIAGVLLGDPESTQPGLAVVVARRIQQSRYVAGVMEQRSFSDERIALEFLWTPHPHQGRYALHRPAAEGG